jgi:hypothetical protein
VNRVDGTYSLSAAVTPARSPNALEPIQVDVALHSQGAHVGGVQLGDGRMRLYANLDPSWGLVRLVSEDEKQPAVPSAQGQAAQNLPLRVDPRQPDQNTIELAGGALRVWSRFVRNEDEAGRPGATSISSHIWLGFRNLDLNQLAHVADVQSPDMPGLIDGAMDLYGTTGIKTPAAKQAPVGTDPAAQAAATQPAGPDAPAFVPQDPFLVRLGRSLYGDGQVRLRNANLANFGPISDLYNMMHIGNDKRGPTGYGDVAFRIEGNAMNVTRMHYFNRGVEVRAQARVGDLAVVPDCPLSGTAVGSARPLKDVKLPILSTILPDVDQILSALQNTAATVQIGGTLHKPTTSVIPFNDLGQGMKEFLTGDIRAEVQGSAGQ